MLKASDGSLWCYADSGRGDDPNFKVRYRLIRVKDGKNTAYSAKNGFPANSIYGAAEAPDKTIWIATGKGLARFDGKGWTVLPSPFAPADPVSRGVG